MTGLASMVPITPMAGVPLWRQTMLLHGSPKIGKTTEVSKLGDVIYLDAENGTIGIDVATFENLLPNRNRFTSPITLWDDVDKATSQLELATGQGLEGVIVIDTAGASWDMCRLSVLKRLGIKHETDLGFGKGWRAVKDEYTAWIARLKAIGFGIVFISHTKEIDIETPTSKYTKKVPRLDTGPNEVILPFVNLILYAEVMTISGVDCRVMHTKPSNEVSAGERGINTRLQPLLPFDFDVLQRAWDGELIDLNLHFFGTPTPGMIQAAPVALQPMVDMQDLSAVMDAQDSGVLPMPQTNVEVAAPGAVQQIVNTFDAKPV